MVLLLIVVPILNHFHLRFDKDDNVLLEINQRNYRCFSSVAYIMSDILRTTVANGIARRAQIPVCHSR